RHRRVLAVAGQARGPAVEELAGVVGAWKLVRGLLCPVRIADGQTARARRLAGAEAVGASAHVAGLPLHLVVVVDQVELAGADVRAVDDQKLEAVQPVGVVVVVPDTGAALIAPRDAERRMS